MLTWQSNYLSAGQKLGYGDQFVHNPDMVLNENISVHILIRGMRDAWFTGVGLGNYISGGKVDYVNARRIVNGMDRAYEIADLARTFENALRR